MATSLARGPLKMEEGFKIKPEALGRAYTLIEIDARLDTKSTDDPNIMGKLTLIMFKYKTYKTQEPMLKTLEQNVMVTGKESFGVSRIEAAKFRRQYIFRLKHLNILWLGAEWKLFDKFQQMSKINENLIDKIDGLKRDHALLKRRLQFVMREKKIEMKVEHTFGPDEITDAFGPPLKSATDHPLINHSFNEIPFEYLNFFFGKFNGKSRCKAMEDRLLKLLPDEVSKDLCEDMDEIPSSTDIAMKVESFSAKNFGELALDAKWMDLAFRTLVYHLRRMEDVFLTERNRVARLETNRELWRKKGDRMKADLRKLGKGALTTQVPYEFAITVRDG